MNQTTTHNPDRYIADLRQMLSQGRKRVGLLIGAGAPLSVRVTPEGKMDEGGEPLIPDVARLTKAVIGKLGENDKEVICAIRKDIIKSGKDANIENILTKVRQLSQVIGDVEVFNLNGEGHKQLADEICKKIGEIVAAELPKEPNPYTELVSWIGGTHREHPVEIFTPNYDLLIEEAFERARRPYFDGFSGAHRPFFEPASISEDSLPTRWSRVWKIHGSLGWEVDQNSDQDGVNIIRTGDRKAAGLIYPDHLKYEQITRQPYSAFFERLRKFLEAPDSLLLCLGFSFSDEHITTALGEALAANANTAIFAFQYQPLDNEKSAVRLAEHRANMSVYACDGAVISGVRGEWKLDPSPKDEWKDIRKTFWGFRKGKDDEQFLLGDFAVATRFLAFVHSNNFKPKIEQDPSTEPVDAPATNEGGENANA